MKIDIKKINQAMKLKQISVQCVGIKKRCRSIDRHSIDLGNYSTDTTLESLVEEAKQTALNYMKNIDGKIVLSALNIEVEPQGMMLLTKFVSQDLFNKQTLEVGIL